MSNEIESTDSSKNGTDSASSLTARKLLDELRSLPFSTLFPVRRWRSEAQWREAWVQGLLLFTLFPLILTIFFANGADLRFIAFSLGLYFALAWGVVLFRIINPSRVSGFYERTMFVFCFTAFIGVAALFTAQGLPIVRELYHWTSNPLHPVVRLIGFVLGVGLLEETTKAVPILWLALKKGSIRTPREAAFLAGVSGLGFGVAEAADYSIHYAQYFQDVANSLPALVNPSVAESNAVTYLATQILRLTTSPFIHCIWSVIVGCYVGLAVIHPSKARPLVIVGIITSAVLHGLYDWFLSGPSDASLGKLLAVVIITASLFLFVSVVKSLDRISDELGDRFSAILPSGESHRT